MPRRKMNGCGGRFSAGRAHRGRLDAVVHAVADEMHQRVAQLLDDGFVELRVRALDGEFHVFVQVARQVVHQPPELLERGPDGHHADVHGALAEGRSQPFHFFRDGRDLGVIAAAGKLAQPACTVTSSPTRSTN
jgi:hypothetical protein